MPKSTSATSDVQRDPCTSESNFSQDIDLHFSTLASTTSECTTVTDESQGRPTRNVTNENQDTDSSSDSAYKSSDDDDDSIMILMREQRVKDQESPIQFAAMMSPNRKRGTAPKG